MDEALELVVAERAIYKVLCRCSRGSDRGDLELVRSCYWPDATDDHGPYKGDVDGFIAFLETTMTRFERTCHFLGNSLIDVDLEHDVAGSETYAVAYHRLLGNDGAKVDSIVGLRYVDRFEQRQGEWRIAKRVCVFEWRRTDPVVGDGEFPEAYVRGVRSRDDVAFRILE